MLLTIVSILCFLLLVGILTLIFISDFYINECDSCPDSVDAVIFVRSDRKRYIKQIKSIQENMSWIENIIILKKGSTEVKPQEGIEVFTVPEDIEPQIWVQNKVKSDGYIYFGDQVFPINTVNKQDLFSVKGHYRFFGTQIGVDSSLLINVEEDIQPVIIYNKQRDINENYILNLHFEEKIKYVPKLCTHIYLTDNTKTNQRQLDSISNHQSKFAIFHVKQNKNESFFTNF
jgi:hypothetical protein